MQVPPCTVTFTPYITCTLLGQLFAASSHELPLAPMNGLFTHGRSCNSVHRMSSVACTLSDASMRAGATLHLQRHSDRSLYSHGEPVCIMASAGQAHLQCRRQSTERYCGPPLAQLCSCHRCHWRHHPLRVPGAPLLQCQHL